MNLLHDLPLRDRRGRLRMIVETPGGSRVKLKYDPALELFEWSRLLVLGSRYPHDFGFFPQTLADDGDALDAILLADEQTWPGVAVPVRVIGALRVEQQRPGGRKKRNDRLLCVPALDKSHDHLVDIDSVPQRVRDELQTFCHTSLALTGKRIKFLGWADAAEAEELVAAGERAFAEGSI